MTESRPEALPLRRRTIGRIHPEDDNAFVVVDHIFAAEGSLTCGDCGAPAHDPGMIGLFIDGNVDEEGETANVLLTASEALVLAERLQRAAALVLESGEDHPDVEREAARFGVPDELPGMTPEDDPNNAKVWDAWRALDDKEPSPVKRIARDLGLSTAYVAGVVFPASKFGHSSWHDNQEPDIP